MALTGRFGRKSGRPYIEGQLVLPQFKITADLCYCSTPAPTIRT